MSLAVTRHTYYFLKQEILYAIMKRNIRQEVIIMKHFGSARRHCGTSKLKQRTSRLRLWLLIGTAAILFFAIGAMITVTTGVSGDVPMSTLTEMDTLQEMITLPQETAFPPQSIPVEEPVSLTWKYKGNDTGLTITGYNGELPEKLMLPSAIDGKPITEIGSRAFYGCTDLASVIIPDNVTHIGDSAFCGCTSLTSVVIPDSVTSMGYCAFYNCDSLISVSVPDSISSIGVNALVTPWLAAQTDKFVICGDGILLKYNGSDTNLTIPSTVKKIMGAFEGHTNPISITIPDSVTSIGDTPSTAAQA